MASTTFGKTIKKRLIDLEKTQGWLCEQVSVKTGLYFDDGYLSKICTGKLATPKMVEAIQDILGISMMPETVSEKQDART